MFRKSRKIHPTPLIESDNNEINYVDTPKKSNDEDNMYKTKTGNLKIVIPELKYNTVEDN